MHTKVWKVLWRMYIDKEFLDHNVRSSLTISHNAKFLSKVLYQFSFPDYSDFLCLIKPFLIALTSALIPFASPRSHFLTLDPQTLALKFLPCAVTH